MLHSTMDYSAHLDVVRQESARLSAAARSVALDTPVPSCPNWTMARLVTHIGQVQQAVAQLVRTRANEPIPHGSLPGPPAGADVIDWFQSMTAELLAALAAVEPTAAVWGWAGENTAGFWARRQAHEVAVHRWDAQRTAGSPDPLPAPFAVDGIDELLALTPHTSRAKELAGKGETLHLHCTDVKGEWMIRLAGTGLEVQRAHGKGDVAARGLASDLDLFLWGRVGAEGLEVFGDRALLGRFQMLTAL